MSDCRDCPHCEIMEDFTASCDHGKTLNVSTSWETENADGVPARNRFGKRQGFTVINNIYPEGDCERGNL